MTKKRPKPVKLSRRAKAAAEHAKVVATIKDAALSVHAPSLHFPPGLAAPIPAERLTPAAESARQAVRTYGRDRRLHGYVNPKGKRTVMAELGAPLPPEAVPILFEARVVPVVGLKGGAGTFARAAIKAGADVKVTVAQQVDGMAASVCVWAKKGPVRVKVLWTDKGIDHVQVNGRTTAGAKKLTLTAAKTALA